MKKLLLFTRVVLVSAALALTASCSKVDAPASINEMASDYPESEAMENFVEILSRAVSQSEDVRSFLKEKALEQVDNDYDVFYPFVRDEKINDRYSFREYLVSCSDEAALSKIEQRLPLLTIYVPDLTWIKEDAFSVNSWDISSNEVLVCNMDEEGTRHFYYEGKEELELKSGEGIVSAPFLVVKNNERIKATGSTKAGNVQYEFISPVFDGRSADTKGGWRYRGKQTPWKFEASAEDHSDVILATDLNRICPDAAKAYQEFKGMRNSAQRDYCYYGMTKQKAKGTLDQNIRDRILRLKVSPSALSSICDSFADEEKKDPFNITKEYDNGRSRDMIIVDYDDNGDNRYPAPRTLELAMEKLITGGKLEFEITTFYGKASGATYEKYYIDADVRDLFVFKKIEVTEYGPAFLKTYRTWVIKVDVNDIEEKWFYPDCEMYLPAWNLYDGSTSVHLVIKEIDSKTERKRTYSISNTVTTGFNDKVTPSEKYEYGVNTQFQTNETYTCELYEKQDSDEMGELTIGYVDPYIRSASSSSANPNSYTLMSYSTGRITLSFLPDKLVY